MPVIAVPRGMMEAEERTDGGGEVRELRREGLVEGGGVQIVHS